MLFWILASGLSLAAVPRAELTTQETRWLGGRIIQHRQKIGGLAVEGPPSVTMLDRRDQVRRRLRSETYLAPDTLEPNVSAETAAEEVAQGWLRWPRDRGTLVLFPEGRRTRLAWRFQVAAAEMVWLVWVDAQDGMVFHAEADSWTANIWAYEPNPLQTELTTQELLGLKESDDLVGRYVFATTCTEWSIDPRPFGERVCLTWEHTSKPNPVGDYFHLPQEGLFDDPFAEGQVYVHTDRIARWADSNFGLHLDAPIQVFTNFPLTNAFYGDFDADGDRDLSFGISEDGYNLGYDSDVVYHEFGHALVRQLAGAMWMQADSLGLDWTPGALNEGMADTFAMIQNPDPLLGESLGRSDKWEDAIRDASTFRTCPSDLQSQVHRSGQIWGSTMWRLIAHPDIGPDLLADIVVAAVSTWSNGTDWPDAAASILTVTGDLFADGIIGPETSAAVEEIIAESGMLDCERIIDLERTESMRLILINYGLSGDYERVPGGVQFRHWVDPSADHLRLRVSDFSGPDQDTGLAIYIRLGAPVEHEPTTVDGLGLRHAVPIEYDAVFDIDSDSVDLRLDEDTVPGFEPGVEVYGSIASINRARDPLDVVYLSVVLSADSMVQTGHVDLETEIEGGCGISSARPAPWKRGFIYVALLIVACFRRRSVD